MEVTDKHFAKYMDSFWPYLVASLQNHAEYSVCAAAVGIVGDMCRTFGAEMANFSDKLMDLLVSALSVSTRSQDIIFCEKLSFYNRGVTSVAWCVYSLWFVKSKK